MTLVHFFISNLFSGLSHRTRRRTALPVIFCGAITAHYFYFTQKTKDFPDRIPADL
jgi:hypothetical protein